MTRRRAAPRANAASAYVASERREYWKTEVLGETDQMITEMDALSRAKAALEKMIADLETPPLVPGNATLPWRRHIVLETPLHIAQECLYNREKRQGIDLVHDDVERALLKVDRQLELHTRTKQPSK